MSNGIRMVRDTRDEWPQAERVPGQFDIWLGGLQGYPWSTAHMLFICPHRQHCGVLLGPKSTARPKPNGLHTWAWDGNMDAPTLTPSINCLAEKDGKPTGGCGWHGFITAGVMR